MTREEMKKQREKAHLDRFISAVGWAPEKIEPGETPDFVVHLPGARRVAVEHQQVFGGRNTRKGSALREEETFGAEWMRRLADAYYRAGGKPACVSIVLGAEATLDSDLVQELAARLEAEVKALPVAGRQVQVEILRDRHELVATAWVRHLPDAFGRYDRWRLMNHAVGCVGELTAVTAQAAITRKAADLTRYRGAFTERVLLLVADFTGRSGMLRYAGGAVESLGFDAVWLLHHPVSDLERLA